MAFNITIQGTVISFPSSGQSPNWAPAIIQFAESVEEALSTVVGPGDITTKIYTMVSNSNTDVSVTGLQFSTAQIRGANISYAVYRTATGATVAEKGNMQVIYNQTNPTNFKWEIIRDYVGESDVTFTIDDSGQVKFSSSTIGSGAHTGTITFNAAAFLQ